MKKQDKEVLIIFVIIILVIVFMAIFLGVLAKPNEPHFKITKEECRNETYYDIDWESFKKVDRMEYYYQAMGCEYIKSLNLSVKSVWCIEYEKIIKGLRDSVRPLTNITKEVCEQVEVEEIRLPYPEDVGCAEKYGIYLDTSNMDCFVSKQDLSIEWLDENAHCEDCSVGTTNKVGIKCISKCSKYKIGNYTIETWTQIK